MYCHVWMQGSFAIPDGEHLLAAEVSARGVLCRWCSCVQGLRGSWQSSLQVRRKVCFEGPERANTWGFALLDCMFQAVSVCWKYMQYVFEPICCQLRCAICAALSSVPGALHLYAPVCSSWTLISSGTHERNGMNMFGNTSHEFVRDGTMMVSRWLVSALMLYVFTSSCMSVISLHVSNTVMKGLGLAADIVHCPCHHPHRAASRFVGNIQSPPSVRMGLQPSGLCLSAILPGLGFICMDHDLY